MRDLGDHDMYVMKYDAWNDDNIVWPVNRIH